MTWESRRASIYGYYESPVTLGALYANPISRDFSRLSDTSYALHHGHLIHFRAGEDAGDTFTPEMLEQHLGGDCWAEEDGFAIYYRASVGERFGSAPSKPSTHWKRLVKFWLPEYRQWYTDVYAPSQTRVKSAAIQGIVADNGSFQPSSYCTVRHGQIMPVDFMSSEEFAGHVESLTKHCHLRGVRLWINQASMDSVINWWRIHRWVAGVTRERISFWIDAGKFSWAQWAHIVHDQQMLREKVSVFDAIVTDPMNHDHELTVWQALLCFTLLRGPFDFLSLRMASSDPKYRLRFPKYAGDLLTSHIGEPITRAYQTLDGFERVTTLGTIRASLGRIDFEPH